MTNYKLTYWGKNLNGVNALFTREYLKTKEEAQERAKVVRRKGATNVRYSPYKRVRL